MRKKSSLTLLSSRKKKTRAAAAAAQADARGAAKKRDSRSSSTNSREDENNTAAAAASDGDAAAATACEVGCTSGKRSNASSRHLSEERPSVTASAPGQHQPEQPQQRQRRQRRQHTEQEGEEEGEEEDEQEEDTQVKRKRQRRKQQEGDDNEEGGEEGEPAAAATGAAEGSSVTDKSGVSGSGSTTGTTQKTRLLGQPSSRPTSRWRQRKSATEYGEEEEDDDEEQPQQQRGRSRRRKVTEKKTAASRGEKVVSSSDSGDPDSSDGDGGEAEEDEQGAPPGRRSGTGRLNNRSKAVHRCRKQANSAGRRRHRRIESRFKRRKAAHVEVERGDSDGAAACRSVRRQRKSNSVMRGAPAASSSDTEEDDTEDALEGACAAVRSAAAGRGGCGLRRRRGRGGGAADAACLRSGRGRRKGGSRRKETALYGRQEERESEEEDGSEASSSGSTSRSGGEAEEKPTGRRQGRRGGPGKRRAEKEYSEGERKEEAEQTDFWYDDYFSFNECNVQEELVLDALVATIKKTHAQHYYGDGMIGEQEQKHKLKPEEEEETPGGRSSREERPHREKALSFLASLRKGGGGASRKSSATAVSLTPVVGRERKRDKRGRPTEEELAAEAAAAAEFEKAEATLRTMTSDALLIKKAWAFVAEDAYETRLAAAAATCSPVPAAAVTSVEPEASASAGSQRGRRQELATTSEAELQQGGRRRTRTPGSAAASESAAAHPVAGAGAAAPEAAGSPRARQRDGEELARGSDSSGAAEGEEKAAEEQESGDNKEGEKRITKGTLSAGEKRQQRIREDDSSSSPSPQQSTSDGCSDTTLAAAAVATTAAAEAANEEARGEALETGLRARWEKYVLLREQRVATELRIQDLIRLQERRGAQKRQHQAQQSKEEQRVKGEEQQQQRECKVGETRSETTAKGSSGDPCIASASSEAVRTPFSAAVNPVAAAFLAAEGMPRAKEEWRKQQLAAAVAAQKRGQSAIGKSEEEKCVKSLGQGDGCEQCKSSGMPTAAADAPGTVKTTAAAHPSSPAAAAPGTVKSTIAAAASTVVSVETAGTKAAEQGERKATHVTEGDHEREEGRVVVAGSDDAVEAATTGETGGGVADARSEQGVPLKVTTGGGEDAGGRPKEEGGGKAVSAREEKEVRIDAPGASGLSGSRSRSRTPGRDESSRSHSLPRGQEDDEGDEEGAAREKEEEEEEKAEKLLRKLTQADADESLTSSSSSSSSSESRSSDEEDSLYEEDTALGDPPSSPEEEDEEATRSRKHAGTGELPAPDGEQKAAAAEEMGGRATVGGGRPGKVATTGGRGKGRGAAAAGAAAFVSEATAAEEEAQDASGGMRGKGRTGRKGSNTDEEEEKDERKREKRDRSFSGGSAGEGGPEALPAGCKKKKLSTAAKLRLRWERDKQKKRLKTGDTLMDDVFARCSAPLSIDQATKMKNLSVPATLLLRPQCLYTVEDDWERLHCRKYPNGLLRRGTLATHAFRIEETLEFFLFCRFLNLFASTIDIQWTFDSLVAGFACMSPLPPFPAAAARREGATAGKVAGKDGAASPAQTQARDTEEANDFSLPAEAASSCCSNSNKDNGEQDNPSNSNRTRSINSSGSGASDNSDSSGNSSSENLCGRSGCNNYGNYGSTEMFRLLLQKIFSFVGRRFTPGMSLVRMCGRYVEEKRKEGVLPVGMLWPFDYSFKFGVAKLPATRDKDSSNKDSTSREGSNRGKESGSSDRKESSATRKENNGKKEENSSAETSSSTREGRGNVPAEERASSVLETPSGTGEEKSSNSVNKKTVYQSASSSGSMRGTREDEEAEVSSGEKVLMESVYNPFKLCEEWNQLKSIHKLRVVRLLVDQALSESPQIQKARKKLTDADLEMGYKGTDMLGKLYWLVPQCGDETIFKLYREDPSTQRMEILCEDIASLESVAEALGMDEKTADMKDVLLRCHEDLLIQEKQKSREIRRDKARRRQLEISAWGLPSSARRERKPVDYTYAAYDGTLEGRASAGATAASSAEGQRLDRGERLRARQAKKEERMTAEAIEVAESSGDTAPTEGSAAAGAGKPTASSSKDPADTKKPIRKRQPKGAAVVLRSQADVLRQHQAYLMQHRHHSHFALQQSQALLLSQQLQRIQEEKEAAARQGAAARMYQQQQQPVQGGVTNSAGATCSAPAGVAQLPQAALAMLQQRLQQVHHHLLQQEGLTTQQRQAALQHACARLQTELLARYGAVSTERTATPQQQQLIQQHLMRQQQQQQLQARHQMQQQQHMIQQHLQHLQEQVQRQQFMHPSQQLQQQQLLQRQVPHLSVQDSDLLERRAALLQQSFQAHQLHLTRSAGGTLPQQHVQPPNYLVAMPFNAGVRAANGAPPVNAATVSASALSSEAAYAGFLRQPAVGLETNACRTLPLDTVSPAAVVYESADPRVRCSGSSGKEDAMHRKADTAYISERRAAPMDASSCSLPPPGAGFSQSSSSANVVIGGGAAASPGPAISAGNMQYAVWASAGGRNSATLHAHNVLSGGGDPPSHAAASGRSDGAPTPSPYPGLSLSSNASPHGVAPTLASLPHAKVSASHLTAPLPSSSVHGGDASSSSSQTRRAPQLACPIPPHLDTLRSCHAIPSRLPACSTDGERYSLHSRESPRESLSGGVEERYGVSVNFNGAGDRTDQVKGGGAFKQFTEGQQHQQVHGYKSYEGSG